MRRIQDPILLRVISGVGANIVKEALAETAVSLGWAKTTCRRMAARPFFSPQAARSTGGMVIETMTDLAVAATSGVLITYVLTLTGQDHATFKGVAVSNGILDNLFGIFAKLGKVQEADVSSNLLCRGIHMVFGVVSAALITRLGDPGLFRVNRTTPSRSVRIPVNRPGVQSERAETTWEQEQAASGVGAAYR